jgi:hypothetical protein
MFGHLYLLSQQSHKSAPTADRMNVSMGIIGSYRWPDYFVNVHQRPFCRRGIQQPQQ